MKDTKEAIGSTGAAEKWTNAAAQKGTESATMEICHGSVCLGSQKPTHCICPTDKK